MRREVRARLGNDATYEERRDAAAAVMGEVLWEDEEQDLEESATDEEEIEVSGKVYRRLAQESSATYYGRWGPHVVHEPLYREVGVRNGPTIKPLELRVGMIAKHLTPDFARILGELSGDRNSREIERTLRAVGLVPPSRAFIEKRVKLMAAEVVECIDELEEASRGTMVVPAEVASISCGLDRFSVRMSEPLTSDEKPTQHRRKKPYLRTPPPPKEYHYRKAWVGSVTIHGQDGEELHTWRYATEPEADSDELATRVAADVAWVLEQHPEIPVHCIQDAAPELRALPVAVDRRGTSSVSTRSSVRARP